jgi:phage-related baseplate assembly protein
MTAKIEVETCVAVTADEKSDAARKAWIKPAFEKFSVCGSETANKSSNFDGSNYSS